MATATRLGSLPSDVAEKGIKVFDPSKSRDRSETSVSMPSSPSLSPRSYGEMSEREQARHSFGLGRRHKKTLRHKKKSKKTMKKLSRK